jgi:hypothetical protein
MINYEKWQYYSNNEHFREVKSMDYKAAELSLEEIERLKQLEQDLGENIVLVAYMQEQMDHADTSNQKKF